ncbi:MAG: hypothetical protein QXQ46_05590 [Thermoplasmatales archaeon]
MNNEDPTFEICRKKNTTDHRKIEDLSEENSNVKDIIVEIAMENYKGRENPERGWDSLPVE